MYEEASKYADQSNYPLVKAVALIGFAKIDRFKGKSKESLATILSSIAILSRIGAKNTLAEAYYQLGLTYQGVNDFHNSHEEFRKAIQLFNEIDAPKQVERVKQAMQNWQEPGNQIRGTQ